MFARLIFPTGTLYTQICRDVTRAIVNSTGAGGSTVGALEFADQTESTIDDTVAAGWTLAPGFTVATGADVDGDARHVIQCPHTNTSTISVAIRTQWADAGRTKANNFTNSAVCLYPVSEFGESYELDVGTPDPATSASTTFSAAGVTGNEVYIIARPGVLMVAGERNTGYPGYQVNFIVEADGQECREGRNRPGVFFMQANRSVSNSYSSTSVDAKNEFINYTTNNGFSGYYQRPASGNWVDCMYDYRTEQEWRVVQYFPVSYGTGFNSPSSASVGTANYCSIYFDADAADGCGDFDYSSIGEIAEALLGAGSSTWAQGINASAWYPRQLMNLASANAIAPKDLNGDPAVKFVPAVSQQGFSSSFYDYSAKGGYYMCTGNFPGLQTILNTSEGDFLCIKLFASSQSDPFGVAFRIA